MDPIEGNKMESVELSRLKEKVRALERQNAMLKQNKNGENGESVDGAGAALNIEADQKMMEDIKLIDLDDIDGGEDNWLLDVSETDGALEDECSWLRKDVMSPDSVAALKKKSLVNKLDDIAKRSPSHTGYGYNGTNLNGSYRVAPNSILSSPYKSFTTSPPSAKYSAPTRGQAFDPRTFTRSSGGRAGAYSLPPEDDEGKVRKSSYHRLNFGAKTEDENILNSTYDRSCGGNDTYSASDKLNSTFNKTSDILTDNQLNELNTTYDRNDSVINDGLNSTFTRNGGGGGTANNATFDRANNATFERGNNATFDRGSSQSTLLNATFEKDGPPPGHNDNGSANHRKMSEDRLSSASSSCDVSNRLSRESSQDILVEDLDRLSTTSAMSESSVSHRLNDVQDVQDIARMQEESLKHSTPMKNPRSDTISPLSETSLSSPVEDAAGYQSEESCGSESGIRNPRRGEIQQRLQVYSSQDSLPDSPYSSQSLDSHASHGNEVRRSMPNLNKLRGGKVGRGARVGQIAPSSSSQYGLSQPKYHNSESRLQQPPSRMQAPVRGLRAPGSSGLVRPSSGLRPPGQVPGDRKLSGIARPQGLPRPSSRLQQPGSYLRSGLPMRGAPGGGRAPSQSRVGDNKNWIEDCY